MNIEQEIIKLLHENLSIQSLQVINKSHEHDSHESSPKNGQSHFNLIIEAKEFKGLTKLARQKMIYTILQNVIPKIHALSLTCI